MIEKGCYCKDCLYWDSEGPRQERWCRKEQCWRHADFGCVAGIHRIPPPPDFSVRVVVPLVKSPSGKCSQSCLLRQGVEFNGISSSGDTNPMLYHCALNWSVNDRPGPGCPRYVAPPAEGSKSNI